MGRFIRKMRALLGIGIGKCGWCWRWRLDLTRRMVVGYQRCKGCDRLFELRQAITDGKLETEFLEGIQERLDDRLVSNYRTGRIRWW